MMNRKCTRFNVEVYANEKGLQPLQIDGIPEGFSFIEPDITIGGVTHSGMMIAFIPNSEGVSVRSNDLIELLDSYNKKRNGN